MSNSDPLEALDKAYARLIWTAGKVRNHTAAEITSKPEVYADLTAEEIYLTLLDVLDRVS
jgi:hypothetical protein